MSEALCVNFAGGMAAIYSARAPDREGPNQDAAAVFSLDGAQGVLAVADGVGGQSGGASASRLALEALSRALSQSRSKALSGAEPETSPIRGDILDGIEAANRAVLELGIGAGTTLAAIEVLFDTLRPYHVGDSEILVVGQRGRIKLQTISHSPVGYAVEAGVLDQEEAMHHDERHIVSNIVGSSEMRIEVGSPLTLAPLDTVLLATDGVFDNLGVLEIVDLIRTGSLPDVAARLALACTGRMRSPSHGDPSKPDDLTFIVYRRRA